MDDIARARAALFAIDSGCPRDQWLRAAMAAKAAGLDFGDFHAWCKRDGNKYCEADCRSTWKSIDADGPVSAATLFHMARERGWQDPEKCLQGMNGHRIDVPLVLPKKMPLEAEKQAVHLTPDEIWNRCQPATNQHGYIVEKNAAGVPLNSLRVVPAGDSLRIVGESMTGALAVPLYRADGTLATLQFIATPDVAARLKAQDKPGKLNLPGHTVQGWHTVGQVVPGDVIYLCEGIATAWTCWQAKGHAALACFGWGRVRVEAAELRQQDASAKLVLVPDAGKEAEAEAIAREVGAAVACMPPGSPPNFDANDFAQREGTEALADLLDAAKMPPKPEPRYKLLSGADIRALPPLRWRIHGVLPAEGLAGLYGLSASGKSFLALDMAAAIAEGRPWFDCRVEAAPVVYVCLEGEAGFRQRVAAWEAHHGRMLPDSLSIVLQPFRLTEPQDMLDLAAVVPAGAVVFLDTLNRAAPTTDENSSRDMGGVLEAAKTLQRMTGGLVALVHHAGKDATKGLRGHSSLFAALDAVIEVFRDVGRREWRVAKSKDGIDGAAYPFKLQVETLGQDENDEPITSCVVVPDVAAQDVKRARLPQGGNQWLVLDALRPLFQKGVPGKPGAPPARPCIELEAAIASASGHLTCEPARRVTRAREAITGLVTRGVMGCNEGWIWLA